MRSINPRSRNAFESLMSTTSRVPRYFSAFFGTNFDNSAVENIDRYKDGVLVLMEGVLLDRGCVIVKQMQILLEPIDFTRTSGNDVPDWRTFSKYRIHSASRKKIIQIYFADKAKFESRAVYYKKFLSSCSAKQIDRYIKGSLLDELRLDVYECIKNVEENKFCIQDYCTCCQNELR